MNSNTPKCRGVAQFGRALPWGGRGRGFKSRRSDHYVERKAQHLCWAFLHANYVFTDSFFAENVL